MSISASRFQSIFNGMTSIAQKVYEAVPKAESWHFNTIQQELMRLNTGRDLSVTRGCLRALTEAGLIAEAPQHQFMRVMVRGHKSAPNLTTDFTTEEEDETPMATPQPDLIPPKPPQSPFEKLALMAAQVNTMSTNLKRLSSDMETVILEIEELAQSKEAQVGKLHQLQRLLKELA